MVISSQVKTQRPHFGQIFSTRTQRCHQVYTYAAYPQHLWRLWCFSSIILSPRNGNVKMSPHERKDIRVESEGTTTSERDFQLREGRLGVRQSRRTALT